MSGHQRVDVIGNVGKDPELRYMPSGAGVLNFSIAVNEKWKDGNGQLQEHTEWFNCALFGKRAESLEPYIKKGQQLHVGGTLRTRKWQDRDGNDRYSTDLRVDTVTLLGGPRGASGGQQPAGGGQRGQIPAEETSAQHAARTAPAESFEDDEIPF